MYCIYCKNKISENEARVVDKNENVYHILCYLQLLDIQLDMIDEEKLEEGIE